MLAPRHFALHCKAFANMDTSNEMDTDVLQVSSTSDERPTSQVPSHALAVIQTAAKASSESDSSPHVRGRNRSSGSVRSASAVALGSRHARTPSPYARNKAKRVMPPPTQAKTALLPPPAYACEVATAVAHPLGNPVSFHPQGSSSSTPDGGGHSASPSEIHLHKHQQLGVIVHGVDPNEHARVIADAGNVVSSMRHEAQGLLNRAEQQIAHTQHEAQNVVVQAQHQVNVAKQQAQSAVQQVHQQAQAEVAFAKQQLTQSESMIVELRQRNAQLEQQQSEMMQQMAQLQSMVHQMQAVHAQQTDTSHVHARQIESLNGADPNMTAVADAMKALATHVGETMNELKQVILASSPGRKARAKSAGIPASGHASGSASSPSSFIPRAASPIAAPPAAPSHVPAKASAKVVFEKHKPAAPPPSPPGPDVYELASHLEEGEEEENYGDQGWFDDDPEVDVPEIDIDLFGDTLPRVASVGAGSFPVSSPKASSDVAHDDYESETYKYKDLKDLKLPGLPKDSVGYRSWRNAVLTQFGSIDRTGTARILKWLQACLKPEANTETIIALQSDSNQLPRLDAYLASQISETRYMKGEFGLEIQSYIERAHARGITPSGRAMLAMGHAVSKISCGSCAWCDCYTADFACCKFGWVFLQSDDCL